MRRLRLAALVLASATSCSIPGTASNSDGYKVTAYFAETVSLYPHSPVRVMGMVAGRVDSITVDGAQVRVEMTIDRDVPLPTDVHATISALTLIGERTVILSPPWKQGKEKAPDGFVIPREATVTPVEPDEGLKAFVDVINAIEPKVVNQLVTAGAEAFGGHEQTFNDLLATTADIWRTLGAQDQRLIDAAERVHALLSEVNQRGDQLNTLFAAFADASKTLADQRTMIGSALDSSVRLVDAGTALLDAYGGNLPGDLAALNRLGLTLEANTDAWKQIFGRVGVIASGITNAYDPESQTFRLGVNLEPTLLGILKGSLGRLLNELNVCPPANGGIC